MEYHEREEILKLRALALKKVKNWIHQIDGCDNPSFHGISENLTESEIAGWSCFHVAFFLKLPFELQLVLENWVSPHQKSTVKGQWQIFCTAWLELLVKVKLYFACCFSWAQTPC